MNGLIVGVACIFGTLVVICAFFLIGVAIWQYCDGRYGENPFELFCDYFYDKGKRRDVVEVVKCKDCKFNGSTDENEADCGRMIYKQNGNDYCSYGKREEQEHDRDTAKSGD